MATAVNLYLIPENDTKSDSTIVKPISVHHNGAGMPLLA
jgi:hypothetical protein